MSVTRHYDLFILGAGSGALALGRATRGLTRGIADPGPYGGTCLNRGCIPTKMLLHAAALAGEAADAAALGVDLAVESVRWIDIRDRVFGRIDPKAAGSPAALADKGIDAYAAPARFVGPRRLIVDQPGGPVPVEADRVVLATGAHPVIPPIVTDSVVPYETSDTIMRLDSVPRRLLILGGGVLGLEMAQLFSDLGSEVTIVSRSIGIQKHVGEDIARRLTSILSARWALHLDGEITGLERVGDEVRGRLADGTVLAADTLLVAAGRRPTTDDLGLDLAGVDVDAASGRVLIDGYGRTSAEGVWALGDVAAKPQLKHLANDHARTVTHNLLHPSDPKPLRDKAIPAAMFTRPQVAWVGASPDAARADGMDAVAFTQRLGDTAYGWALEDTTSVCTVVARRGDGVVLGAQLMAPMASSLIQPLIDAVARGLTADDAATTPMWIHPAASELVENALIGAARAAAR